MNMVRGRGSRRGIVRSHFGWRLRESDPGQISSAFPLLIFILILAFKLLGAWGKDGVGEESIGAPGYLREKGKGQKERRNSRIWDILPTLLTLKFLFQGKAKENKEVCDHEANA